jgi:hypothetical protein
MTLCRCLLDNLSLSFLTGKIRSIKLKSEINHKLKCVHKLLKCDDVCVCVVFVSRLCRAVLLTLS